MDSDWSHYFELYSELISGISGKKFVEYLEPHTLHESKPCDHQYYLKKAAAVQYSSGLCLCYNPADIRSTSLAKFSILPTPFPKKSFELAVKISPIFTKLIAALTLNPKWLYKVLDRVASLDSVFTQKMITVAQEVYGETTDDKRSILDDIIMILIRSDYMLHLDPTKRGVYHLKQVELNTISLSFAPFSQTLSEYHRSLLAHELKSIADSSMIEIPDNKCFENIVQTFVTVDRLYQLKYSTLNQGSEAQTDAFGSQQYLGTAVLMVVHASEKNIYDQEKYCVALSLQDIFVIQMTFQDLENYLLASSKKLYIKTASNTALKPLTLHARSKGRLFIADKLNHNKFWEISIIYYRTGYNPEDYDSCHAWEIRRLLEFSDAVKCPNILTHLGGVKAIQCHFQKFPQDLLNLGLGPDEAQMLESTFARQIYLSRLEDTTGEALVEEALQWPDDFFLKPQREGGLHNITGVALYDFLNSMRSSNAEKSHQLFDHSGGYILMERLKPPRQLSASLDVRANVKAPEIVCSISELGTFGAHVRSSGTIVENSHAGYLLRTKHYKNVEGGVAVGAAYLDSPLLV